jgi:hypothetical protein
MPRWLAFLALALVACHARPAAPARAWSLDDALPELGQPFSSGPLERGPDYVRRTYRKGPASISVTVAQQPITEEGYAGWVRASSSYPQLDLGLPPDRLNGFFNCSPQDGGETCDLHLQLRSGFHVEFFGSGTASKADLQALASALPLPSLAARENR